MSKLQVAIVYHTKYGHTKLQAEAVAAGVNAIPDTTALLLTAAEGIARIAELDACDAIVFGSPTYMGNISAGMKEFLEATVSRWFSRQWQNKIAGGFTNSSNFSGDKLNTEVGLVITAMQLGMIWVGLDQTAACNTPEAMATITGPGPDALNRAGASLGPMAASFSVKPPQAPSAGDLETAVNYGKRIARIAHQFRRGMTAEPGTAESI